MNLFLMDIAAILMWLIAMMMIWHGTEGRRIFAVVFMSFITIVMGFCFIMMNTV